MQAVAPPWSKKQEAEATDRAQGGEVANEMLAH